MEQVILVLEIRGPKFKVKGVLPGEVLLWIALPLNFVLHDVGSSIAAMPQDREDMPFVKSCGCSSTSIKRPLVTKKEARIRFLHSTLGDADAKTSGEAKLEAQGVVGLALETQDADGLESSFESVSEGRRRKGGCVILTGNHVSLVGLCD